MIGQDNTGEEFTECHKIARNYSHWPIITGPQTDLTDFILQECQS